MAGLGQHYSSTERKVVAGHCLLNGLYVLLGQRCPLEPRMYCQQRVCEAEGQSFQSKVDWAVEEIGQFKPVPGTHTHVLADSWYHCRKVRRAAHQRGWGGFSGGLKSNRVMRVEYPDGSREWLKLSAYAATLPRHAWTIGTWPSAEGDQRLYAHLVKAWVRKLGPTLLLITCHDLDAPLGDEYGGVFRNSLIVRHVFNTCLQCRVLSRPPSKLLEKPGSGTRLLQRREFPKPCVARACGQRKNGALFKTAGDQTPLLRQPKCC